MKKLSVFLSTRIICLLTYIFIFISLVVLPPNIASAGPKHQAKVNKINAIGHVLDSIERRLERELNRFDGENPAPKGVEGKFRAMANQLMAQERKLTKVLNSIPEERMPIINGLEEGLEYVGQRAVRIVAHAQVGSQVAIDDNVLDAIYKLKDAAKFIVDISQTYFKVLWDRVIPLRFVQVLNCAPFLQSCQPHLDWDSIDASVDGLNEALHEIGLHFWIRSVERYYMYHFAHHAFPVGTSIEWADAKNEIEQVFPVMTLNDWPYPRRTHEWIRYMSTIFSDPGELLVWVFGHDSLVSREMEHHSASTFPNGGRTVIMSARNVYNPDRPPEQPALSPYHLTHELGHFFGIRHVWDGPTGINPYTQQPITWPDLWDIIYCPGDLGFPVAFSSRQSVENADCSIENIENWDPMNCHVDNRYGIDDSEMYCTVPFPGGSDYYSGTPLLKGMSFPTGLPEDPPDDSYDETYSFAWGLNVMGYYSRYNAHLWTPGRFSESQLYLIKGHTLHDVPIADSSGFYLPFQNLWSGRSQLGN